jgi:tRNA pseudouridine55 synthase
MLEGEVVEEGKVGGLLNINKPKYLTSFDVVRKIKSILGKQKVGHCGTLDPMATGVLLVLYGQATGLSRTFMEQPKVYLAEMTLGIQTDTGDITGRIMEHLEICPVIGSNPLKEALAQWTGEIVQKTPLYSAAKRSGKKFYEYTRAGIPLSRPPRMVTVYSIDLIECRSPVVVLRVTCGSGTYIRSLVEDIGKTLHCPATLSGLVREQVGDYRVGDSLDFKALSKMSRSELISKATLLSLPNPKDLLKSQSL